MSEHVPRGSSRAALRARRDDIPLLAGWFASRFAVKSGQADVTLDPTAIDRLLALEWPGNVRELRNLVERPIMLAEGPHLCAADVDRAAGRPATPAPAAPGLRRARRIADLEREAITQPLDDTRGNSKEAARRLGISRRALYRRLDKLGFAA
jgi:two-component system NtrC family response regulator